MKTKQQIDHFLRKRKYKSEINFEGISFYCMNKHNIKLHSPSSYYPNDPDAIDYETFAWWLEHGFGAGDAVKSKDFVGLVQDADVNKVKLCLRIDSNGPNFDSITISIQGITLAEESVLNRLKMILSENNLEFGNPYFIITEKFIPQSCNLVHFVHHKSHLEGGGVVSSIKPSGEVYMFCYYTNTGDLKYGMQEYLGNVNEFSFTTFKPTDYERKVLESKLNKVGKSWNHYVRRVEPLNMKADKGKKYWYITDKLQIAADTERNTPTTNRRFSAGNYFMSESIALTALERIHDLINKMLAEPVIK